MLIIIDDSMKYIPYEIGARADLIFVKESETSFKTIKDREREPASYDRLSMLKRIDVYLEKES